MGKDYDFEEPAPDGQIWVCGACGKRSRTRAGYNTKEKDEGWDESCFLNAVLCYGNLRMTEGRRQYRAVEEPADG